MLDLVVRPVGEGGVTGPATRERVAIHDSFIGDIDSALGDGSDVFLAIASEGLVREEVIFVVARNDGTHGFLGGCWSESGGAWLRELLGARYDSAMRRIIGLTDREAIYRVLADIGEATDHVLVEYEERPDLRLFSRTATLVERGECLALQTDVGPLVPIWDERHYLAVDDLGLVLMSELYRVARLRDRLELSGWEMSPEEALAVTDRASLRSCPGRLILIGSASVVARR